MRRIKVWFIISVYTPKFCFHAFFLNDEEFLCFHCGFVLDILFAGRIIYRSAFDSKSVLSTLKAAGFAAIVLQPKICPHLVCTKGNYLFFEPKNKKTILLDRIQDLTISQNWLQRCFGVQRLSIETAGTRILIVINRFGQTCQTFTLNQCMIFTL